MFDKKVKELIDLLIKEQMFESALLVKELVRRNEILKVDLAGWMDSGYGYKADDKYFELLYAGKL